MPSHTPDGRVYYTIKEASEAAGVSRRTIYHWLKKKILPFMLTPGQGKRIEAESLLRSAAERRMTKDEPVTND